MEFLDGEAAAAEIAKLVETSFGVTMAVAFWGDGAGESLGLMRRQAPVSIVCNLKTGGTNPHEIEKLMGAGHEVRQCDDLHGKVYLFDDRVIIGSSNASANGLALQGAELAGWREANVVTSDPGIMQAAESWIERLETRPIDENDLEAAKEVFNRRRASTPIASKGVSSLARAVRINPEDFKDRKIYVYLANALLPKKQKDNLEKARQENKSGKSIDGLGWDAPLGSKLIGFFMSPSGKISFDGFYERPNTAWSRGKRDTVYLMWKLETLDRFSAVDLVADWNDALQEYCSDVSEESDEYMHIELGAFYEKFLQKTEPKAKVFNVRDKVGRTGKLKLLEDGNYQSGPWPRARRQCGIIRVFGRDGTSVRGGAILSERKERKGGETRTYVVFADDPNQHGKPQPREFGENGFTATVE
jgi:hypothetical protein